MVLALVLLLLLGSINGSFVQPTVAKTPNKKNKYMPFLSMVPRSNGLFKEKARILFQEQGTVVMGRSMVTLVPVFALLDVE